MSLRSKRKSNSSKATSAIVENHLQPTLSTLTLPVSVPEKLLVSEKLETQSSPEERTVYQSALINAWVGTKMERDKSLFTIASSGIGLLVGLLAAVGVKSIYELAFYSLALLFFF